MSAANKYQLQIKQLLVKSILEHSEGFEWSLQGFGMLRMYLAPEVRLHVWHSRYRVPGVTDMHTHPWHFDSEIIAGEVHNIRYSVPEGARSRDIRNVLRRYADSSTGGIYRQKEILCGVGGHETGKEELVALEAAPVEIFCAGDSYTQFAHEIHSSDPSDGTVTIITRTFLDDADHAFVYTPDGAEWVSAEPRPATVEEVRDICGVALERWFGA